MNCFLRIFVVPLVLVLSGCATKWFQYHGTGDLVGRWESVKAEGKDAAVWNSGIKTAELRFAPDASFSAVVVLEGEPEPKTADGTYQADGKLILLNLKNNPDSKPAESWFEGRMLVVQDPWHQFKVYYRKK